MFFFAILLKITQRCKSGGMRIKYSVALIQHDSISVQKWTKKNQIIIKTYPFDKCESSCRFSKKIFQRQMVCCVPTGSIAVQQPAQNIDLTLKCFLCRLAYIIITYLGSVFFFRMLCYVVLLVLSLCCMWSARFVGFFLAHKQLDAI